MKKTSAFSPKGKESSSLPPSAKYTYPLSPLWHFQVVNCLWRKSPQEGRSETFTETSEKDGSQKSQGHNPVAYLSNSRNLHPVTGNFLFHPSNEQRWPHSRRFPPLWSCLLLWATVPCSSLIFPQRTLKHWNTETFHLSPNGLAPEIHSSFSTREHPVRNTCTTQTTYPPLLLFSSNNLLLPKPESCKPWSLPYMS